MIASLLSKGASQVSLTVVAERDNARSFKGRFKLSPPFRSIVAAGEMKSPPFSIARNWEELKIPTELTAKH